MSQAEIEDDLRHIREYLNDCMSIYKAEYTPHYREKLKNFAQALVDANILTHNPYEHGKDKSWIYKSEWKNNNYNEISAKLVHARNAFARTDKRSDGLCFLRSECLKQFDAVISRRVSYCKRFTLFFSRTPLPAKPPVTSAESEYKQADGMHKRQK